MNPEEFNDILERVIQNQQTADDLEKLRSLHLKGNQLNWVSQNGKFNTNVGEIIGGEFHIGDTIYYGADVEKIRALLSASEKRNVEEFRTIFYESLQGSTKTIQKAVEEATDRINKGTQSAIQEGTQDIRESVNFLKAVFQSSTNYQPPKLAVSVVASTGVAVCMTAIRLMGLLQPLELSAYDWLFQTKPFFEKTDDRITLIEVTNEEINKFGTSEISDRKLTQVLEEVINAQPLSIGLDIFRDEEQADPEAPDQARRDYQNLIQLLEKNQILVACQVDKAGVPGASAPSDKVQLGFSNTVVDGQETKRQIRRQLLRMSPDPEADCQARQSLGYRLALDYLRSQGIEETQADGTKYIQLDNTIFEPVWTNTGGYQGLDTGGYQILINYRRTPFQKFSATEILDGLNAEEQAKIKGRIVLIGYNEKGAAAPLDLFATPLGIRAGVEIHAYTLSHILSTVINDGYRHPLIKTWGEPEEIIWIMAWCFLGGILAWIARSKVMLMVMTLGGAVVLVAIAWSAFAFAGWWLPLVPSLLGLALTPTSLVVASQYKLLPRR